jgi:acetate---CoA ligase (ADP-forming)
MRTRVPRSRWALVADARSGHRRKRHEIPPPVAELPSPGLGPLDEAAAKGLLEAVGIRTPQRRVCASRDEARAAGAELGGRAVVKVLDPAVTHKSEVGGVHVGVDSSETLEAALDAINCLSTDGRVRYLVEELADPGVELILGGTRDPSFGPTVLLGVGGIAAEAIGDVALRLHPSLWETQRR